MTDQEIKKMVCDATGVTENEITVMEIDDVTGRVIFSVADAAIISTGTSPADIRVRVRDKMQAMTAFIQEYIDQIDRIECEAHASKEVAA